MKGDLLTSGILSVSKEWTKQRKAEQRRASAQSRRNSMWRISSPLKFTDACNDYLEEAYLKASGGGQYPANARQVYYAFRGPAQDAVGDSLNANYLTQTLLPKYQKNHPGMNWDVAYDDRGHLTEPRTGMMIGLGTLNVRGYNSAPQTLDIKTLTEPIESVKAKGPGLAYGAFLFIEKEGFMPLLDQMQVGERYDLAIVSTKGMSVTAARELFDNICSTYKVPLLTLHDFDRAGFKIASTLHRNTARYQHSHRISIIDLGLRLHDVEQYSLASEDVVERVSLWKQRQGLRKDGATTEEIEYLVDGQRRVELNAFTSDQFVEWLESKLQGLQGQGIIKKVILDSTTLERVYRANVAGSYFKKRTEDIAREAWGEAKAATIPDELMQQLQERLADDPAISWWEAIKGIVSE